MSYVLCFPSLSAMQPADHLAPGEVAAYVRGGLTPELRARLERHLADCADCVADVTAAARVAPRRRAPLLWAGGLAAAAIVGLVLSRSLVSGPATPPMDERAAGTSLATLAIVTPQTGDTLQRGAAFVWRAHPEAITYRLTVTDTSGAVVWNATTSDTALAVSHPPLSPGQTYLWFVDVLGADGRTATTGLQRVQTAP